MEGTRKEKKEQEKKIRNIEHVQREKEKQNDRDRIAKSM